MRKKWLLGIMVGLASVTAHGMGQMRPADEGQIRISTEPEGALVFFDGVRQDAAPITVTSVSAGRHLITATRVGYNEARKTVDLLHGQNTTVELKLDPVLGLLLLHSTPNANVDLDGAFFGQTPLFNAQLPLGEYRIRLTAAGYEPREVVVSIVDRTPKRVAVDMASDSGTIRFESDPPGAAVLLNGARRGVTPCDVDHVPSGRNEVEFALEGYRSHKENMSVFPGEIYTLRTQLKPLPGTLTIVSIPSKARVYLDNQYRGQTPLTVPGLEPGEYRIRAELAGHEPSARPVTVVQSRASTEEFRLKRNSGLLLVATEPAGVKVFVDGTYRGKTLAAKSDAVSEPFEVDLLAAGRHILQFSKKGYNAKPRTFVVKGTEIVHVHEKMERLFIPDTLVRTGPAAHEARTGVLIRKHPNGDIELEVRPGIIEKIGAKHIYSIEPIRKDSGGP